MCAFNRELFLKANNEKHNTMATKETKETAIYSVQLFSTNRTNWVYWAEPMFEVDGVKEVEGIQGAKLTANRPMCCNVKPVTYASQIQQQQLQS